MPTVGSMSARGSDVRFLEYDGLGRVKSAEERTFEVYPFVRRGARIIRIGSHVALSAPIKHRQISMVIMHV